MKKLVQKIYRKVTVSSRTYEDAYTHLKYNQVRHELFGMVINITYTPVQEDELSTYLGII
jgi:hypothetical protein